jgi:hypothetical protein
MMARRVERVIDLAKSIEADPDAAEDAAGPRARPLAELDRKRVGGALDPTRADREGMRGLLEMTTATLGEGPEAAVTPVEREIDGDVVVGIDALTSASGRGRVRGEDTAAEDDERQRVVAPGPDRVDVPPTVSVRRERLVESESVRIASAAIRPDSAAIGTPAPG